MNRVPLTEDQMHVIKPFKNILKSSGAPNAKRPRLEDKTVFKSIVNKEMPIVNKRKSSDDYDHNNQKNIDIYFNVGSAKAFSSNCRLNEVTVKRRCSSTEQLNNRWAEKKEHYIKLDSFMDLAQKLRPKTDLQSKTIDKTCVDVRWSMEKYIWEFTGDRRLLDALTEFSTKEISSSLILPPLSSITNTRPIFNITIDDEEDDLQSFPHGFISFIKQVKSFINSAKWLKYSELLKDAVKAYASLQPGLFLKAFQAIKNSLRLPIIHHLVRLIKIDACDDAKVRFDGKGLDPRLQRLFDADGVEQRKWYELPKICSENHGKCRMMDALLQILSEETRFCGGKFFSPFNYSTFYHCIKFGALCQKKRFFEWGMPFYDEFTDYPGLEYDIFIDHSLLIIRQLNPRQLLDLIELGMDFNQVAWLKTESKFCVFDTNFRPFHINGFLRRIQRENVDALKDNVITAINSILGTMSTCLSIFVQNRLPSIMEYFPEYDYQGFFTPVHILRAVCQPYTANVFINIHWQNKWNNFRELHECIPLVHNMAKNLELNLAKLIFTIIRVDIHPKIPQNPSEKVISNIEIADVNKADCVPQSISIETTNCRSVSTEIKPIKGCFKPNEWIFVLDRKEASVFCRDHRLKISLKTTSKEIGTIFLFQCHYMQLRSDLS